MTWQNINFLTHPLSHFGMASDEEENELILFGGALSLHIRLLSDQTWRLVDGRYPQ
jgi:hypothetical protein